MKRKLLAMSLSLVIASSLVLGGCGKEEKEVATSTETEVESVFEDVEDVEDTEKDTEKVVAEATEEKGNTESTEKETEKNTEKSTESKDSKGSTSNTINGTTGNVVYGSTGSSSGNKSGSTSGNSGSTSGNSGSSHSENISGGTSSSNTETPHVHNWVAVTTTVNHPAETHQEDQGHYETVVDSEAWDEEKKEVEYVCLKCYNKGIVVVIHGQEEEKNHILYHYNNGDNGGNFGTKEIVTGTVHHDAVTHQEWVPNMVTVVDKEAWDEEVITGYKCSECGATK